MKGDKRMTEKEFEKLYKNSPELTPPSELKANILLRMDAEMKKKEAKKKARPFPAIAKRLAPLAACFVLVLLLIGGLFGLGNEDYQTVYIDVNPSVALHVNRLGKVSGVEYLNEDAKEALDGVKLKGLAAEDALETMLDAYEQKGYFEGNAEIYISAVSEKNKNCDKLLSKMQDRAEKVKGNRSYGVNVNKLTAEDKNTAKDYGISPGKYRVIEQIIEQNPNYTVEDLKNLSMAELKKLLPQKPGGGNKNNK